MGVSNMKAYLPLFLITFALVAAAAYAQSTSFTLGAPHNNYLPVESQDGAATNALWYENHVYDCALTTVVCAGGKQHTLAVVLPVDPVTGGGFSTSCTGTVTVSTVVASSPTPLPNASISSTETCLGGSAGEPGSWTGSVTYIYAYVKQTHCSSGRGSHCVTAYYPVVIGGAGNLEYAP
jgi:hypothetical protein